MKSVQTSRYQVFNEPNRIREPRFTAIGSFRCDPQLIVTMDTQISCTMRDFAFPKDHIPALEILLRKHCEAALLRAYPRITPGPIHIAFLRGARAEQNMPQCIHPVPEAMQNNVLALRKWRHGANTASSELTRRFFARIVKETEEHLQKCCACHVLDCQSVMKAEHRINVDFSRPLSFPLDRDPDAIAYFTEPLRFH